MERLTQGRLAPVHRKDALTIPLKYLRRKWTMQSTDDDGIVFIQPACASASQCVPIGIAVEKQSTTPVQALAVNRFPMPGATSHPQWMTEGALQAH